MKKCFFFLLGAAALLCSSCSKSEIERLEKIIVTKDAQIERLNAMLAERESRLTETTTELEAGVKTAEKATEKIKTLTDENLKLKKSLKVALENPKGVVSWFKSLPEEKGKVFEKHGIIEEYIRSEGLDCLFLVINGLDRCIKKLKLEVNYHRVKFHEILSAKKDYEEAIKKMKADGINVDKYLKLGK